MGTPGDKTRIDKVVAGEPSQLDPNPEDTPSTTQPLTTPTSPYQLIQTTAMGVISRQVPQFAPFPSLNAPTLTHTSSKPESFQQQSLEQATLEDYYTQSKFYSEPLYPPPLPQKPPKTFLNIDEPGPSGLQKTKPGPSGLQTPKSKSASTITKVKKKKQEHGTAKKSYTCSVCHKNFMNQDKFNKHQQTHSGSSQFKCDHCKKSFTSKFKLVRHALIHSDRKPFSCTVCERTFHRKDHLKNHIKVHSPSKKVYICEKQYCSKQYTSLLSYRKHLAVHAAEEGNLTCQICSATFATKDEILYHLKVHAGSRTVKNPNEKKFTCEYCDRRFFTKKDVRRHLVVHTGMRDFLCQFCPQRFGRKDHLVRHIKKAHNKKYAEALPSTATRETTATTPQTTNIEFSLESVKTIFGEDSLKFEEELFLTSASPQSELKELGSEILEEIEQVPSAMELQPTVSAEEEVLGENVVFDDPEMLRLLETTEEKNLPLPGFSQTFQPPPPP